MRFQRACSLRCKGHVNSMYFFENILTKGLFTYKINQGNETLALNYKSLLLFWKRKGWSEQGFVSSFLPCWILSMKMSLT